MSKEVDPIPKKSRKGLLIGILIILVIVVIAVVIFSLQTSIGGITNILGSGDTISTAEFIRSMDRIVLKNNDFPISYQHTDESRFSNDEVIGEMTIEMGKTYIIETSRVDGWEMYIEKLNNKDIGPSIYRSRVEIFETVQGAKLAFSRDWLWVYTNPNKTPDEFIDQNCNFGDECLLFMYQEAKPGALTNEWDVLFRYKNVIAWVMVRGSDLETFEQDALDAAQVVYDRILAID
jgi:hypothetical protein